MPEEINRVVTDHVSTILFAPNEVAVKNLALEGITGDKVRMVGDVMYDAALYHGDQALKDSRVLETLGLKPGTYLLSTIHRAENTDNPARLRAILEALESVAAQLPVILPLHPRTRAFLPKIGFSPDSSRVRIIDPVGYLDMVMLERHARLIATDSGGVQKEAFFYRVPCITLRDETEWVELVELGWNMVVPPQNADSVASAILGSLDRRGREGSPYGDGASAQKIVEILAAAV
jgi:UDP-GlcNAc3NAcA epimerase